MNKKQFIRLLQKYRQGMATEEEKKFIETYYNLFETEPGLENLLNQEKRERLKEIIKEGVWERVIKDESVNVKVRNLFPRIAKIAAACVLIIAGGVFMYLKTHHKKAGPDMLAKVQQPDEIRPGGNKAVLTLSNGKKIVLDNAAKGSLARQGAVDIRKQDSGELVYQHTSSGAAEAKEDLYNIISTPLGGEYRIVLADGTKIWLNAGSSLRYPIAFNGRERRVTLNGEAYFEVARQKDQPFTVEAGKEKIQVLGTSFNVKAYEEEKNIKTTLAEGAVKITTAQESRLLRPGEQASLDQTNARLQVSQADMEEVLAWKNGLFLFDHSNIKTIMQEVARWYDVVIQYKTHNLENENYSGIVSRYSNVSELLKRLEMTGTVHFKIEGRIITVMN